MRWIGNSACSAWNFWHPTPTCRASSERVDYGALPFPPLPTDTGTCPLHTVEKIYGILQQSGHGFLDVHLQSPMVRAVHKAH